VLIAMPALDKWIPAVCGVVSLVAVADLARTHWPAAWSLRPETHVAQQGQRQPMAVAKPGQAGNAQSPTMRAAPVDEDPLARGIAAGEARAVLKQQRASADVRDIVPRIILAADNAGLPFLVVDKRRARLFIFDAQGRLLDNGPVLLGLARGDFTVPGIAERPIEQVRPFERTTPSGRFIAQHGSNSTGEDVLWVDYDAAVSMHRVRATVAAERRLQRLASPSSADNRISFGCINLPPALYENGVLPLVQRSKAVVYVLPETQPLAQQFQALYDGSHTDRNNSRA
jgi:hypothetical protein